MRLYVFYSFIFQVFFESRNEDTLYFVDPASTIKDLLSHKK